MAIDEEIKKLNEATAQAKEASRELHGLLKDCKEARKDAQAIVVGMRAYITDVIEREVKEGLEGFNTVVLDHIDKATQAIYKRFDGLTDTLLGTDKKSRKKGEPSIPELIEVAARMVEERIEKEKAE